MKFRELKKSLAEKVEPIYLACGDDAFFVENAARLICERCVTMPEINLTRFESSVVKEDFDRFNSALFSCPFMSEKRVVLLKEFYPLQSELNKLKQYFEHPCDSTVLVICNVSSSEQLKKQAGVTFVDCSRGDEALIRAWMKNKAAKEGLVIADDAIGTVTDYCMADMTRINGETEKLVAYCAGRKEISVDDVRAICVKETDYRLYEIVEFIASKNYDKAYDAFTDILGVSQDGQKLFVSLYYYFRRLLYASISGINNAELADALGVKEYAMVMAKRQAKAFSSKRLFDIVEGLAVLDESFKTGKIEQNSAIWNAVFEVMLI